ncbi:MAG: hypothetical protein NTV68_00125 [Methanomicrobiales archaeon]|nr:hypothetical protein [Methanomicrobiales archaeon]
MTRGKVPSTALAEAEVIAGRRGEVRLVPGKRGDSFDLIIFEEHRTIFVKVKRSVTKFSWPLEVLHQYQREIAHVHRIPLTVVTAREFWVRHPNGTWQFFLIRHDSIIEIWANGAYTPLAELPIITSEPAGEESSPDRDTDFTSEDHK